MSLLAHWVMCHKHVEVLPSFGIILH